MAMLGAMLLATLRSARQLHRERDLRQCEFLLRAGEDRALLRLSRDSSDYQGETWKLPAASIVGSDDGQVTIEISRPSGDQQPQITVVAEYPSGSEQSIRRSRTFQAPLQMPPR
jgi:hypothetical protein